MLTDWRLGGVRTLLFVPADKARELLPKAIRTDADGFILDLEDAVVATRKPDARIALKEARLGETDPRPLFVRVNACRTEQFAEDIRLLADIAVDGVVIPKVEGGEDVECVLAALESLERRSPVALLPMIETPRGVVHAHAIAAASNVVALALGAEDLAASVGLGHTAAEHELLYARSHIVFAAAAAGVWALDTPSMETRRPLTVRREAHRAQSLGFVGKLAVHPMQVSAIHEGFRPAEAAIRQAAALIAAMDHDPQVGARLDDGRMVDRAVILRARRTLARAAL